MAKLFRHGVMIAISALLAGCFTSEGPLISNDDAVAPYERITFKADSNEDISVALREGKSYVVQDQEVEISLRFMEAGDDLFLVETAGESTGQIVRLFGLLKLDRANGTAAAYKVISSPEDAREGLRVCPDDTICIDDPAAYIALAKAEIASGAEPAAVYEITLE